MPSATDQSSRISAHVKYGFYNADPSDMVTKFTTPIGTWNIEADGSEVKMFIGHDVINIPSLDPGNRPEDNVAGDWKGMRVWPGFGNVQIAMVRITYPFTTCGWEGIDTLYILLDFRSPGPVFVSRPFGGCGFKRPRVEFVKERVVISFDDKRGYDDGHVIYYKRRMYFGSQQVPD